jgi:mono/diheme cytochrome c family protein
MERRGLVVLVLVLVGCKSPADNRARLIERGAYVADLGACPVCHTPLDASGLSPDRARRLAGGFEVTEVFGTWRAPNITPDVATGIGAWSDAELIAAIREGKRRDGTMLKAVMPYPFYAGMTDADVRALVAYLRSVPPVVHAVERRVPPLPDVPAPAMPRVDDAGDPLRHGQYLATIMHCALCHTPVGPNGPELDKAFAGGTPIAMPPAFGSGALFASNITGDAHTGIGAWSEDDVIRAVRLTLRPDHRPIFGPMMLYVASWSRLTDADARALATYIKSIPAVEHAVPPSTFRPAVPAP